MQQLHYTFNNYINNRVYISNLKKTLCVQNNELSVVYLPAMNQNSENMQA